MYNYQKEVYKKGINLSCELIGKWFCHVSKLGVRGCALDPWAKSSLALIFINKVFLEYK